MDVMHVVAPTDSTAEHNTIRRPLTAIDAWELGDHHFAFDSSVLLPSMSEDLLVLIEKIRAHPGSPLAIFGHADPVGHVDYNKTLSGRRASALLGLPSAVEQLVALEAVTRQGLNVRQTEELVRRMAEKPAAKNIAPKTRSRDWKDAPQYESQLRDALGTKVALKRGRKGGQIVISFFSDEEFSSIFERLTHK